MINMNKNQLLLVMVSFVLSLNSYAAGTDLFSSSGSNSGTRQPLQQPSQSNTSTQSEPIMQTLPAAVETAIQSEFVQDSASNSEEGGSTDSTTVEMPVMNNITIVVGVSLTGRVIDPAGLSVSDITVKAVQGDETLIAITDNNGNYQFALTQGVWSVFASDLDYDITPAQKIYQVEGASITRIE